ncbi:hypothetical protein FSST1_010437 [Fusarium sambucinum]
MLLPPEVVETIPSIPPPTPGGPADHRSERAMGEFLVEGDSDDESLDLPEDMHCPCSECIARFTTNVARLPSAFPRELATLDSRSGGPSLGQKIEYAFGGRSRLMASCTCALVKNDLSVTTQTDVYGLQLSAAMNQPTAAVLKPTNRIIEGVFYRSLRAKLRKQLPTGKQTAPVPPGSRLAMHVRHLWRNVPERWATSIPWSS